MQPSDLGRFRAVMTGMAKLYEREIDSALLEAYWLALHNWPFGEFKQAAGHLMATSKWMPRPADFTALRQASELTAGEAWEQVLNGRILEPGSRTERAANIVGGQQRVRMADIERDLPHIERRFLAAYDELTDVDTARAAVPTIARTPIPPAIELGPRRLGRG